MGAIDGMKLCEDQSWRLAMGAVCEASIGRWCARYRVLFVAFAPPFRIRARGSRTD